MQKHPTSRICKVSEIPVKKVLEFPLTKEQRARIPSGKSIKFRKSTSPYKPKLRNGMLDGMLGVNALKLI